MFKECGDSLTVIKDEVIDYWDKKSLIQFINVYNFSTFMVNIINTVLVIIYLIQDDLRKLKEPSEKP